LAPIARCLVKVLAGVCRGKNIHDKRESNKQTDANREMARQVKSANRRSIPVAWPPLLPL